MVFSAYIWIAKRFVCLSVSGAILEMVTTQKTKIMKSSYSRDEFRTFINVNE